MTISRAMAHVQKTPVSIFLEYYNLMHIHLATKKTLSLSKSAWSLPQIPHVLAVCSWAILWNQRRWIFDTMRCWNKHICLVCSSKMSCMLTEHDNNQNEKPPQTRNVMIERIHVCQTRKFNVKLDPWKIPHANAVQVTLPPCGCCKMYLQ